MRIASTRTTNANKWKDSTKVEWSKEIESGKYRVKGVRRRKTEEEKERKGRR